MDLTTPLSDSLQAPPIMPSDWIKLPSSFYLKSDVVSLTREFLGKIIVTTFDGHITAARIVEAEAYAGVKDRASHAYNGRRTARTEIMYCEGGTAYVYLCYGIHNLFNVIVNERDVPHGILIRAAEPLLGIEQMLIRTGKISVDDRTLTKGPANVSKALGIRVSHTGQSLLDNQMWIASDGFQYEDSEVAITGRIGVNYAGEDALLPYRFLVRGNRYVSGKKVL
ncbi:methylpurine-DNA glycosylase (MPG) domain-containing protein [Ditylenchus destructor]|nr:methylpurine-DNA glycosylase (MPG) domain-containing protein [Ditylenchus destructor]